MDKLSYDWDQSLGAAVFATARSLRAAMADELRAHGVTFVEWMILALLVRRDGRSQSELADAIGIEPATVCRALDDMEAEGWVERTPCPDDRRRKLIVLCRNARPVWRNVSALAQGVRQRALQGISSADARILLKQLTHVRSNLQSPVLEEALS